MLNAPSFLSSLPSYIFEIIEVILGLKNQVPITINEIPMYRKVGVSTAIDA